MKKTLLFLTAAALGSSLFGQREPSIASEMKSSHGGYFILNCENDTCISDLVSGDLRIYAVPKRDASGEKIIEMRGTSFAQVDKLYGYMDADYNIVIPAEYDKAYPFYEGLAVVTKFADDGSYISYHIDKDNNPAYTERFVDAFDFVNGAACVDLTGGYDQFHINHDGDRLYPRSYYYVTPYSASGYAVVQKETVLHKEGVLWVVIDKKGNELVENRGDDFEELNKKFQNYILNKD